MHETLAGRARDLHETMLARTNELQMLFDTKGPLLADLIASRGGEAASEVVRAAEQVSATLEDRSNALVGQIGNKQHELARILAQSTDAMRHALETTATASVDNLIGTNERLKAEMGSVLERLFHTNSALQTIIGGASENLTAVETSLQERVREFQGALGTISNQVISLNHTANNALAGVDRLTVQVEQHTSTLDKTVDHLADTQQGFDRALDNRRQSIESLLAGLENRAETFESIMQTFSTGLEDSLRKAENRAREIGNYLNRSSEEMAGLVDEQFGHVRSEAEKERSLTSEALRAAYEQANTELAHVFGQTLERFRAAAGELKGISGEIHRELEETRQEVRRGASDLPRETAEQAAAMRRVVAEQIRALNDLTELVGKAPSRALDLAEAHPVAAQAAAPQRMQEPARPVEKPRTQASNPVPSRPAQMAAPATPARTSTALAPARSAGSDRTGWLSDLLARASEAEPANPAVTAAANQPAITPAPKAPGRPAASLDTISLDISRMVDHAAASEAWERYYRGDRNAFSRVLYTVPGQQTFDEIRRRYGSDHEFHETVDRYTQEFERLLNDVARDDRDGTLVRTYLTSETGKVYTLLAHAAGRLD